MPNITEARVETMMRAALAAVRDKFSKFEGDFASERQSLARQFGEDLARERSAILNQFDAFQKNANATLSEIVALHSKQVGALVVERVDLVRNTSDWLDRCLEGVPS